ncbi:hypothetical protein NHQ30_006471 [Ciborinia camelliae]|nr:hypothetical protein NHQ30_006471 [Ciborinia camelliae]
MAFPLPPPKVPNHYQEGFSDGIAAEKHNRVQNLSFQYSARYKKGYEDGVAFERKFRNPTSDEARKERRLRRARLFERCRMERELGEWKVGEERRVRRKREVAKRVARRFHVEIDKAAGATDSELRSMFQMRISFKDLQRTMEVRGPSANLDLDLDLEREDWVDVEG